MDGRMDGWTDRQMDSRSRTNGCVDDGQMDEHTDKRMNGRTGGLTYLWTDE